MLPLSYYLSSVRHFIDGHVYVLEEDDEVEGGGLIYPKTEGRGANNWIVLEVPEVTMLEK